MPTSYVPNPIDTSHIHLSPDLEELGELLARNTHENFVQLRLEKGRTYGPARDDVKRQNPTLIPYDELPEEEKEFDRRTSSETLKVVLALGYQISKPR